MEYIIQYIFDSECARSFFFYIDVPIRVVSGFFCVWVEERRLKQKVVFVLIQRYIDNKFTIVVFSLNQAIFDKATKTVS